MRRHDAGSDTAASTALDALSTLLAADDVQVIDLTHPLSERTPVIDLPEPFTNTPGFTRRELARYDERGSWFYWNAFESAEHVGTHFDAPVHWITGRDGHDVASIPPGRLVGPAVVIDKREEVERDPDNLLTVDDIKAFEAQHGPLPEGGWLLMRTGWADRHDDAEMFLGADDDGPHWPGPSPECARWLADETSLLGFGSEAVGIDAGIAYGFDPPYPAHHHLLGADKYGLASLANLEELPAVGSILIAAPLRIAGGSGSSMRALALVPRT
jgi:kynurenine formamidase